MTAKRRILPALGSLALVAGMGLGFAATAVTATPSGAATAGAPAASGVTTSGALYAWGDDDAGQLGVGTIADAANHYDTDAAIPEWSHMPAGSETLTAAAGQSHTLVVTIGGVAYATGYNFDGQLGTGNTVNTTSPVRVDMPAGVRFDAVAAGYDQSMALSAQGGVYTWGKDDYGQAGIGVFSHGVVKPTRVSLPRGATATAIGAGSYHDLAVTSTGAVYDWGLNSTGQLGNGGTKDSDVPVKAHLPTGVTATAVAGAAGHSLALTSTGAVYAWGDNSDGQLGDGSTVEAKTPVPVDLPAGVVVTAIAAGDGSDNGLEGGYSLALTSTGAIYAWGNDASGNLGDDSTTNSDVPVLVQVPAGVTPVQVTSGGDRCHLLSSAGTIYDWGSGEKPGHAVHLVPTLDTLPAGMTPVAIDDGPAAEQYLTVMRGSSLELTKSSTSTYSAAGQTLTYTYGVADSGTTKLSGVSVADDRVAPADLSCPATSLVKSATESCTGTYTTTPSDVTAGKVTNTATASATGAGATTVTSNTATFTVKETQGS